MNFFFASLCIAALLIAPVSAQEQDYAIKLNYPLKVNQRYHLSVKGKEDDQRTFTTEGKLLRNERTELNLELESTVTVLEVDSIGRATKEAHQINRCVRIKDGFPEVMLGAGTKLIAFRRDGKPIFEVQNKPVSAEIAKALSLVISTSSGGPSDDEIFGTTERKKVGDTWSINEELALKDLQNQASHQVIGLESLSGTTTLHKVTKDGTIDVLHLVATLTGKITPPPSGSATDANASIQINLTGAFPEGDFKSAIEESMTMTLTLTATFQSAADRPAMEMSGKATRLVTVKRKPLS